MDVHGSLEGSSCDAVISVNGVQFNVDKSNLSDCSKYFQALFLRHSAPDRKTFEIPGLSAATMQLIVDFANTGSVSVTEENVQDLLEAANQFIITDIEQVCCKFLLDRLHSENCIRIWHYCNVCLCSELQQKAYHYLLVHFENVYFRKGFQQLSVQELSGILDRDELNVRDEMTVCKAIFMWLRYEPAKRLQHLALLLSKVRLAFTSQSFLAKLMKTQALSRDAECMKIVQQAQKLKTYMSRFTPRLSVCANQAARPRLPNTFIFAIGGYINGDTATVIEAYDFLTDRWNTVSAGRVPPREGQGAVFCNGYVYCVGGYDIRNAVYRLDLTYHMWLEVAPMFHSRKFLSATVLDRFIYAIGGECRSQSSFQIFTHKSAERYDPQTNQWQLISYMREPRSHASSTSLHNKIYICGGINQSNILNTCEFYCPETNQWTSFTSMREPRFEHGIIAYNDLIFAVGGWANSMAQKTVEAYNPETGIWKPVSSMLSCRHDFGIAVIYDKLFVVGTSKPSEGFVEYYDMSTDRWSEACQMEVPRLGVNCCVVSGLPNVAEYIINRDNLPRLDEEVDLVES